MKKINIYAGLSAAVLLLLTACNTVPKNIPDSMTAQELIQNGQSNFESGNYKAAYAYYNKAATDYADWPQFYIEARYEIAHLYLKQKKYKEAEPIFKEIRLMYDNAAPGTYPAAFNKLAEIGLNTIAEHK